MKPILARIIFFRTCVDSDVHLFMLLFAGSGTVGQKCPLSLEKKHRKKKSQNKYCWEWTSLKQTIWQWSHHFSLEKQIMTIVIINNDRLTPDAVTIITIVTASEWREKKVPVKFAVELHPSSLVVLEELTIPIVLASTLNWIDVPFRLPPRVLTLRNASYWRWAPSSFSTTLLLLRSAFTTRGDSQDFGSIRHIGKIYDTKQILNKEIARGKLNRKNCAN